jgi:pterin-4a-carbinolamine dehydratase
LIGRPEPDSQSPVLSVQSSANRTVAENEGHHPDFHLQGYRNVWIELWTHAIGGLSENDFILAAKIDELPIAVKTP